METAWEDIHIQHVPSIRLPYSVLKTNIGIESSLTDVRHIVDAAKVSLSCHSSVGYEVSISMSDCKDANGMTSNTLAIFTAAGRASSNVMTGGSIATVCRVLHAHLDQDTFPMYSNLTRFQSNHL